MRTGPHRLEARVSVGEHVISASLVLLGVGVIFPGVFGLKLLLASRNTFDAIIPMVLLGILGVFLVWLGVMSWGRQRMEFDGRDRVLRLKRAEEGLGRHIPFDDIETVRIVTDHRARVAGKIDLTFSRPTELRLGVMIRIEEADLVRDASALAEFIGVPVRDTRLTAVPNPHAGAGEEVSVNRSFTGIMGVPNFRTHKLVEAGQGMLVVEPTREYRAYRGVRRWLGIMLVAGGIALLGYWVHAEAKPLSWGWPVFAAVLCLGIGVLIVWAAARISQYLPVFIDRARDEIRGEKLQVAGRVVKRLPLQSVAAVQIASCKGSYTPNCPVFYEINLVLTESPGERLTLMAHSDEPQIRANARRLSEFLNVPLVDHTARAGDGPGGTGEAR